MITNHFPNQGTTGKSDGLQWLLFAVVSALLPYAVAAALLLIGQSA